MPPLQVATNCAERSDPEPVERLSRSGSLIAVPDSCLQISWRDARTGQQWMPYLFAYLLRANGAVAEFENERRLRIGGSADVLHTHGAGGLERVF